jgi:hypothetical protein
MKCLIVWAVLLFALWWAWKKWGGKLKGAVNA